MIDPVDPTLLAEREHHDKSRGALSHMRKRTEAITDNAGDELTAFALGRLRAQRLADLAIRPDTPLFFGRLRLTDEDDFHIGRRHVVDESGNPMILDWRAPLSRTFYQASVRDPHGVTRRRRFGFDGGTLTGFEDENLMAGEELGESSGILAEEIERPRVGPMRDIVATIQPEQDDLVRADLGTTICVQGAPGTGKTAVGLHRAAYLLYAFREQLARSTVLIVGPNAAFMSYVQDVLPTLGEVEVTQRAVDELTDTVPVKRTDDVAAARVKHDIRMATVLHRAVWGHVREPEDSLMVTDGSWRWRIGTQYLRDTVTDTRADDLPYLAGRERVRARVVAGLRRQAEIRSGDSPSDAWGRKVGRTKAVTEFLDAVWPKLDARRLVTRLFTDAEFRARVCEGILEPAEQDLLASPTRTVRFTTADTVLIDEVAGLLERPGGYGHIVVDEAQDLSAMQCRVIARRSTHGSVTVLGDLAQGTAPWAAADWRRSLEWLGKPDGQVVTLTTGFRVPADIIALANRLLPALRVDVPPARSLRTDGLLETVASTDLAADIVAAVTRALDHEGSVAVIAADTDVAALTEAISTALPTVLADGTEWTDADILDPADGHPPGPSNADAPDGCGPAASSDPGRPESTAPRANPANAGRVTVVPASIAKGLEYDHVIVAEPATIVAAEPMGLRRLYVVLTRAVSRLTVVHSDPLPPELTE